VPVAFPRTCLRLLALGWLLCATVSVGQEPPLREATGTAETTKLVETAWPDFRAAGSAGVAPSPAILTWQPSETVSVGPTNVQGDGDYSDASCDACPRRGLVAFVSYDSWRGIADGGWQNNGIVSGANYGTRLGRFSELTGFGLQAGGSVGVFDWNGTDYRLFHASEAQSQGFFTYGLFRRPNGTSNWSAALVNDWMVNAHYGEFGQDPTMSQLRGQVGYATSAWNEFGVWGTVRVMSATINIPTVGLTEWRPINQLNFFWHHKWGVGGADTLLWFGVPEHDRLTGGGSLGDYLVGALANVPLNDRVGLYTLLTYMHPSAAPGPAGSNEDAWNFTIGLTFYPGRNARSTTVAGQCWMPMMPVANNGYFLVDTNRTF
jgi:hypothetical protein